MSMKSYQYVFMQKVPSMYFRRRIQNQFHCLFDISNITEKFQNITVDVDTPDFQLMGPETIASLAMTSSFYSRSRGSSITCMIRSGISEQFCHLSLEMCSYLACAIVYNTAAITLSYLLVSIARRNSVW